MNFCLNCGHPTGRIGDDYETVIRSPTKEFLSQPVIVIPQKSSSIKIILLTLLTVVGIAGIAAMFYLIGRQSSSPPEISSTTNSLPASPTEKPPVQNTPKIEATPVSPRPAPTMPPPADRPNMNTAANSMNTAANRAIANAMNVATDANRKNSKNSWPPPYDSQGHRLRAICNDGNLSYWQGENGFTCLLKGGVRVWYWTR